MNFDHRVFEIGAASYIGGNFSYLSSKYRSNPFIMLLSKKACAHAMVIYAFTRRIPVIDEVNKHYRSKACIGSP